jgi:Mor family transcriptional regulator
MNANKIVRKMPDTKGEKNGRSKITLETATAIRKLGTEQNKQRRENDSGGNYKEIAKKFNVCPATVGAIVRGETWR